MSDDYTDEMITTASWMECVGVAFNLRELLRTAEAEIKALRAATATCNAPPTLELQTEYEANVVWYREHVAELVHGQWYCISSQAVFDGPTATETNLGARAYKLDRYPKQGALVVCAGVSTLEPVRV